MPSVACELPRPTREPEQALRDIGECGVAIMPDTLSPDHVSQLLAAIRMEMEADELAGEFNEPYFADAFLGNPSRRVWNLPSRGKIFRDLIEHPVAMALVHAVIEGEPRLSTFSANITVPGSGHMHLHADQGTNPMPWGERPQGLNIIWAIEDFTADVGATRFVPGSHKLNRSPRAKEMNTPTVAIEAPAGSLILMESRVWHTTGANVTNDQTRTAILAFYGMDCFMTNENWYECLSPDVREHGHDSLLRLLGFRRSSPLIRVHGRPVR